MYDAIIVGSGAAGYHCALKTKELGGKALVIEKAEIGGTCTNCGCIPTKALHASAYLLEKIKKSKELGIETSNVNLDFKEVVKRKERVVNLSSLGIKHLLKGIEVVNGEAKIISQHKVRANGNEYEGKNIVVATGSKPRMLAGMKAGDRILTSREILQMEKIPEDLTIIGGGYIGCEFASIFNAFGTKVTIIEALSSLLPGMDSEISAAIERIFSIKGIEVKKNAAAELNEIKTEKILVAIGVEPNLDIEEMNNLGVKSSKKGIGVNEMMKTSAENIYAIGDVTGIMPLAHVAYAQAETAAMNIMGREKMIDYGVVPSCIFTLPEIASVGQKEGDRTSKAGFIANGKARTMNEKEGFIKLVSKEGFLTGAHIIGPHADDLIHEAALAIKNKISIGKIKETIHAHPTLSETFLEAVKQL
ncbi:dihydrolipoyl dehydrogenase [Candidatus Woesearchaeota archaeon]|nr:dihydrolipoyl dehydrogenase [Candidatus Woesearchaeota archaeon]